jgi:hypothetical protein
MNRRIKREAERETARIQAEFWQVVKAYQETIDGLDVDNHLLHEGKIYQRFNNVWVQFCEYWAKDRSHKLKPDSYAFIKYLSAGAGLAVQEPKEEEQPG